MLTEFKEFALRGNVVDMAVGIAVGAAFTAIVNSLVSDVIMPPIGLILGYVDFSDLFIILKQGNPEGPYATLAEAQKASAVTLNYGLFGNKIVSFLIVSMCIFFLVKSINRLRRVEDEETAPTTKTCVYCATEVPIQAQRCPHCTSELAVEAG